MQSARCCCQGGLGNMSEICRQLSSDWSAFVTAKRLRFHWLSKWNDRRAAKHASVHFFILLFQWDTLLPAICPFVDLSSWIQALDLHVVFISAGLLDFQNVTENVSYWQLFILTLRIQRTGPGFSTILLNIKHRLMEINHGPIVCVTAIIFRKISYYSTLYRAAMPFGNRKKYLDYLFCSVFFTIQKISTLWKPEIW